MFIPRKALVAGGVSLGIGALALAGTGTFAGLTGQVPTSAKVTSGTFTLSATAGTPSVNTINGQTLTAGALTDANVTTTVNGEGTTLTYTLSNADSGHTYTIPFTVYDTGSLPGLVTSIRFTPGGSTSLAHNLTISICWSFGATGAGCHPIYGPHTTVPTQMDSTTGARAFTFEKTGPGDNNLTNYLGSNPSEGSTSTGGGHPSLTYEIVETYGSATPGMTHVTNATGGKSTTQTFTVMGHNV